MELKLWQLLVMVPVLAVAGVLAVWAFRTSPRRALLGGAAALVAISGFLLYTLVLDEPSLGHDLNSRLDEVGLIGVPAVLGVGLGVFAVRGRRA